MRCGSARKTATFASTYRRSLPRGDPLSERQASLAPFGALSFAYFVSIGLFNPYAPLWFQSLGFSTLAIGAIGSLQAWTRVVAPYAWSWSGDHWEQGARRATLLRIATVLALLFAIGLLVARSYGAVSMVVLLLFLSNGAIVPLAEAALAQRLATAQGLDVARYGRVRVWGSIGFIVSVTSFGVILQATGIGGLPVFTVAIFAALAIAAWRLPQGTASRIAAAHAAPGVLAVLRRPVVAWFFAGVFLTVLAHTSLYIFFSLYLVDLGYGKTAVGLLWAVSVAAEIAFFWTQGRWFARWNAQAWLVFAAAASVLRFGAIAAFGANAIVLVLAQTLHAFTFAAQHAACITLIDKHFAGPLRGRGQALYTTLGYGASGVLGGLVGGAISERFGFSAVFAASAAAAVGALGCCWRSHVLARSA
jgi:MFS transporter, PPP family, 3-phenylpropionic acid transporter